MKKESGWSEFSEWLQNQPVIMLKPSKTPFPWQMISPAPDPERGKLVDKIPMSRTYIDENDQIWVWSLDPLNKEKSKIIWRYVGSFYRED